MLQPAAHDDQRPRVMPGLRSGLSILLRRGEERIALFVALLLTVVFFVIQHEQLSWFALDTYIGNGLLLVLVALAQTSVLVVGGIDLSIGGILSLANVLIATGFGGGAYTAVPLILLLGLVLGGFNGVLVGWVRLPPIIATLATMSVWSGVALLLMPNPGGTVATPVVNLFTGNFLGQVPNSGLFLVLIAIVWLGLRRTSLLTAMYALGGSEVASRIRHLPVHLATLAAYAASGLIAAGAGIYLAALSTSGSATSGQPYVLTSLAAAVMGGVALSGGRGGPSGAIAGGFILSAIDGILFFLGLPSFMQPLIQGVILLIVVGVSYFRREAAA